MHLLELLFLRSGSQPEMAPLRCFGGCLTRCEEGFWCDQFAGGIGMSRTPVVATGCSTEELRGNNAQGHLRRRLEYVFRVAGTVVFCQPSVLGASPVPVVVSRQLYRRSSRTSRLSMALRLSLYSYVCASKRTVVLRGCDSSTDCTDCRTTPLLARVA